jgi:hypothetical protein
VCGLLHLLGNLLLDLHSAAVLTRQFFKVSHNLCR